MTMIFIGIIGCWRVYEGFSVQGQSNVPHYRSKWRLTSGLDVSTGWAAYFEHEASYISSQG